MPTLDNLINYGLPVATSVANGIFGRRAINSSTRKLTQGGQQGIDTIAQGSKDAQGTLQTNLQGQKTALQPFIDPGAAAAKTLSNMEPYTPQTFNWTPADLVNDPAYQFRLKQGQAAIDAAGNANGTRFSGATLKDISAFNTGEAAQAEQQDYLRNLSTFQENEGNRAGAYKTNAGIQQNLEAQGLNALGQQTSTANATAGATADIQKTSAEQIAKIQEDIATAQAAGDINKATSLQNTLNGIAGGIQQAKTLKDLLSPNATNPTIPAGTDPYSLTPEALGENAGAGGAPGSQFVNPDTGQIETVPYGASDAPTDTGDFQNLPGSLGEFAGPIALGGGAALAAGAGATGAALTPVSSVAIGGVLTAPEAAVGVTGAASGAAAAGGAAASETGAAAATGASSGLMSSVGAFLTNPITIGVGAAILAGYAIIKASQVHGTASRWVDSTQDKFANDKGTGVLNQVVDHFDMALKSGQLSKVDAQALRDQTAALIQQYEQAEDSFAAKGSKQKTVISQSRATMTKNFGPNWEKVLGKMDSQIAALPEVS